MKTLFLSLIFALFGVVTYAQETASNFDKIFKHSGETIDVKVIKVGEDEITFKYPGEDAEQLIGKLAVKQIVYASGRKEDISPKIDVISKSDWEQVQIATSQSAVIGLKKGDEIRGKTSGMFSYHTAGSADKKATRKLKEAAAEAGAPIILLTADKSDGFGIKQSIKKGVMYFYK